MREEGLPGSLPSSCPAGLAKALEGQAQEEPGGPVPGDQPGLPPAQVSGLSSLQQGLRGKEEEVWGDCRGSRPLMAFHRPSAFSEGRDICPQGLIHESLL